MNSLTYRQHAPGPAAEGVVRAIWSLRGSSDGGEREPEPVAPDGCAELVFNVGDRFEQLVDGAGFVTQPRAILVGPSTRPTVLRPGRAVNVIGVRLQPWATSALGVSAAEVRDRIVPLEDLSPMLKRFAPEVLDEMEANAEHARLVTLLTMKLSARASAGASAKPIVEAIWSTSETLSVRQLATKFGRSTRSLQRSFAEDIGMSPRTVIRIARVQCALRLAAHHPRYSWTRIAAQAGYYDQPHFVREFRDLVGMLPSRYRPEPDSLTRSFVATNTQAD